MTYGGCYSRHRTIRDGKPGEVWRATDNYGQWCSWVILENDDPDALLARELGYGGQLVIPLELDGPDREYMIAQDREEHLIYGVTTLEQLANLRHSDETTWRRIL